LGEGEILDKFENKVCNTTEQKDFGYSEASNPLLAKFAKRTDIISDFTQEVARSNFDRDLSDVVELIRVFNNMAPQKMPVYNFKKSEINGETYYKPDKTPLLIREYESDIIRDYYIDDAPAISDISICRILEHDKITGKLRAKIEPIVRNGCYIRTNITIFDEKINNKYILMQISEDGTVNNITEFSGKGKSFKTLFRSQQTQKPVRFLQGTDNKDSDFEMLDCIIDKDGNIARIKRYTNKRETNIEYTKTKKIISVKTKK